MTGIEAATALALCVWLSTTMPLEGAAKWHRRNVLEPCQTLVKIVLDKIALRETGKLAVCFRPPCN